MQNADSDPGAAAREGQVIFEGEAADYVWRHYKRSAATETALLADAELPATLTYALLERDTQPRVTRAGDVTLLILRGVNLAKNSEPEDMISIRMAITARRIVSVELRRLGEIDALIADFRAGRAPETPGAFVVRLVEVLREEAEPVLDALQDDVARLEHLSVRLEGTLRPSDRAQLTDARQDAIQLHRFIAPQAMALETLVRTCPRWLGDPAALREEAEAFRRIAADLESLRGRAQVLAEEITLAVNERTNRIMLTMTAISMVFLPLTAITGLFGANLDGIPFAERPWSFGLFSALLVGIGGLSAWLAFRLLK